MSENNVYDIPINEVAKILDKSDRQVRRYVKENRLKAKPVRIDGHIKLMFNRDEVMSFKDGNVTPVIDADRDTGNVYVDAQLIDDMDEIDDQVSEAKVIDNSEFTESAAVKYVIDALKEQIQDLRKENQELHYQLEQRSGLVGFWQGKAEVLQEEVKALAPVPKEEEPKPEQKKSFWRFWK